jgi:branched-chain amino acid transport system substrate-binding protein
MTQFVSTKTLLAAACLLASTAFTGVAKADEVLTLGMSFPLSGAAAAWGRGAVWMCERAAKEIKDAGGVKVKGKTYNFQCLAYDHKYLASEATKVAQTLLNRDNVKYLYVQGTAPVLASQSLTERQGALLFMQAWGKSAKGADKPLSFNTLQTPFEIAPGLVKYVTQANPNAKTIAFLNPNDATGRESASAVVPVWEKAGLKTVTSDFYERGTTDFQAVAARLASFKPDIIDLSAMPPGDDGLVLKELAILGWNGIKVIDNGANVEGIAKVSGLPVLEGAYMAGALLFDGPNGTAHQRQLNKEETAAAGEGLGTPQIGAYDVIYMLKAGLEAAQSLDPKDIAKVMASTKYNSFYGPNVGWGGAQDYGINVEPKLPVFITQVVNGKLVDKAKVVPE